MAPIEDSVAERERWIRVRGRTVLQILGVILAVWAVLHVVSVAREIIVRSSRSSWPWRSTLVELLQRRFVRRRGAAVLLVLLGIGAVAALFVPTLIDQTNNLIHATPGYIDDLTKGRGRLGFLETKYHIVEKTREFINNGGARKLFGFSGTAIAVTKGILNIVPRRSPSPCSDLHAPRGPA
jgi:hypothetical protein